MVPTVVGGGSVVDAVNKYHDGNSINIAERANVHIEETY